MKKRIIKRKVAGGSMWLYFFPQFEYNRANLYKQQLDGCADKPAASLQAFEAAQSSQMGFQWDPANLLPNMDGGQPSLLVPERIFLWDHQALLHLHWLCHPLQTQVKSLKHGVFH